MNNSNIYINYAKAIFDFSKYNKEKDILYNEIKLLYDIIKKIKKLKISLKLLNKVNIEKILNKSSNTLKAVIKLLIKNKKLEYIDFIFYEYIKLYQKDKNILQFHVKYKNVNNINLSKLENKINKVFKKFTTNVVFDDKSLISDGFIIEHNNKNINMSIKDRFNVLKNELKFE